MIRQLRRLTRPVPGLAPGALAIAVYAEAHGRVLEPEPAADQGFEGVACLDDAARAVVLYTAVWRRRGSAEARATAEGLLRFVCAMQDQGGGFANFILDWQGRRNLTGPTSYVGGWPWTVRALHALAAGYAAFRAPLYWDRFQRGLPLLDRPTPYLDLRAVAVLAALTAWQATAEPSLAARVLAWAEEIAAGQRPDGVIPNAPAEREVHLWGHLQEAALARAGLAFGRADLIRAACASAEALLAPAASSAFAGPRSLPFDVSCTVLGLEAVAGASGDPRYAVLAAQARAWFDGRNAARRPVYDRRRGLVHDGIDGTRVNPNSGAEANIEGGLAELSRWCDGRGERGRRVGSAGAAPRGSEGTDADRHVDGRR